MEKKFVENSNYPNQFYFTIGTAKQYILLVHGFAEDSRIFEKVITHLSKNYTIVLPNLPGSHYTMPLQNTSMESLADYCNCIVQELKINKYIIAGHSMGGYIALEYAKKYSENIIGIALINSNIYADDEMKIATRKKGIEIVENGGKDLFFKTLINSIYTTAFANQNSQTINEHLNYCNAISNNAVVAYYNAMMERKDFTNWIKETPLPIYFAIGKQDVTCSYSLLLAQTTMPKIAFVNIWEDCGHTSMLEKTIDLSESLQFFTQYCFRA